MLRGSKNNALGLWIVVSLPQEYKGLRGSSQPVGNRLELSCVIIMASAESQRSIIYCLHFGALVCEHLFPDPSNIYSCSHSSGQAERFTATIVAKL